MSKKTKNTTPQSKLHFRLTWKTGSALGAIGMAVVAVPFASYAAYFSNRVLPHTSVVGVGVAGKTLPEASDAVQTIVDGLVEKTITLSVGDKNLEIHAVDIGLVIDSKATAAAAYAPGRQREFAPLVRDFVMHTVSGQNVQFVLTYDQEKLAKKVADFATLVDEPEQNAGVKIDAGKAVETGSSIGHRIDQEAVKNEIIQKWQTGTVGKITVARRDVEPKITSGDTKNALTQANALRKLKVVIAADDNKQLNPKQSTIDSWITSELAEDNTLRAAFKADAVKAWIEKNVGDLNQEAQESRLTMVDGKVTVFKAGQDGKTVDLDKTTAAVLQAVRDYITQRKTDATLSVAAVVQVTHPQVTDQTIASLGIVEQIGTATTSYSGSPENRKHNISVGAAALNGILLKPGEEFSTLKYLGKIDGVAGYLPELVIKEDRTTPEFGGGLCQVSTTLFRASMNAGLKITERRNHSYRVSYYEPPVGMDATIYEGGPDFKFANDTSSNILIQSRVEGTRITFDIFGKKDGRRVEQTAPYVFDVTNPPDAEYINTDTLPIGTTKQTEHAHPGATASFTYTVFNGDGSVRNKQTFNSKYVPWKARYLVGTAQPSQ